MMNSLPLSIGVLHFCGIGGIGMSGIAEVLHTLGYSVQGSELAVNGNVERLRALGISVFIPAHEDNLKNVRVVVMSSAIKPDHPEIVAARKAGIPVVRRAEMLGELMRLKRTIAVAGTHGKTTTTTMVGHMLECADIDPTVITGGIVTAYGTNARLGDGAWMVVEADESDGSFLRLPGTIAIVTNIDPEHMEHYKTVEALHQAFGQFVESIPFYGSAILCIDHPEVKALKGRITDRRLVGYGFHEDADVRAINVRTSRDGCRFDVAFKEGNILHDYYLPMHGVHNVQNALSVIAVGREMNIADDRVQTALAGFTGVGRRFTQVGCVNGVTIIDDYGHHPVEIAAVLKAAQQAREGQGRTIAVVQPHRYSRLHSLFEEFAHCFHDADYVFISDVYAAGENPIEGVTGQALVEAIKKTGHPNVSYLAQPDDLVAEIKRLAQSGDFVVFLGAGSVTQWAHALPQALQSIE